MGLVAGCSSAGDNSPVPPYADPLTVGGLPATGGPSGPRPDAAHAHLPVIGGDGGTIDQLADDAINDIETFWDSTYPQYFSAPFHHVDRLISWDSTVSDAGHHFCGVPTTEQINSGYCVPDNTIGWDRGTLLPTLQTSFGPMSVVLVMAHEYGHAVQRQARLVGDGDPQLVLEQQADCFAGAFMRHVAEGNAAHFTLNTTDGLNSVLAATMSIRDYPGDPTASHGTAFERITAVQEGFSDGASACARINTVTVASVHAEMPPWFLAWIAGDELPVTRDSLGTMVAALRGIFAADADPRIDFTGVDSPCPDAKPTEPVSYCPSTDTISVDLPALAARGTPAPHSANSLPRTLTGDYTAYVEFGSRYALSVQRHQGLPVHDIRTALRTACLSGALTAGLADDRRTGPGSDFKLAPGDLDKAISGLLTDGLAASDSDGISVPSGFSRIEAFRWGVQHGLASCAARYT